MQSVTLVPNPGPGQGSPFGGTIEFWSPSGQLVGPGDPWFLTGVGMIPGYAVFASLPFAASPNMTQIGVTNADGTFSAMGEAVQPGSINGLILARSWGNPFGAYECPYIAAPPAVPVVVPVPGVPLLVSTVI